MMAFICSIENLLIRADQCEWDAQNLLACTCVGIHPGRVEPASPLLHGGVSWVSRRGLGVAAFISFAAQANLCRFVSAVASALHTPSLLVLIQVTRQGRKQTHPLTLRKRAKLDIFFKANQITTKCIGFRRNIVFK